MSELDKYVAKLCASDSTDNDTMNAIDYLLDIDPTIGMLSREQLEALHDVRRTSNNVIPFPKRGES